jgi:hypothetical protein
MVVVTAVMMTLAFAVKDRIDGKGNGGKPVDGKGNGGKGNSGEGP